ncbi:hypothetical protein F2Q70_00029660 [Brassica cretica]|uniref:Uncharacterized protein n=1 Tax=Brassica cretica TaxID=69181 RepID=A0A8S9FCZ8_BRACR|nr:hypothetical protein F2Q70_00029660 [Brassica cretica]
MGSRKVDFDRFILLSKWKRMVLSVVSHHRDDFNFGYDRKRKSSQVSMLVLELKKEAVSNYGMTVLNSFKLCWLLVWSDKKKKNCEQDYEEQVVENMTPYPMSEAVEEDEWLISSSTMEKLAATKKYIDDH